MKFRLNRFISLCGITSRRKAESMILNGQISVNNEVERKLYRMVDPNEDEVYFLNKKLVPQTFEYYKMNKPRFYLTTMATEEKRSTVGDLVSNFKVKIFPIGRLDYDSEGLLLFTNDGDIAHKVSHPKFLVQKTYMVYIDDEINKTLLNKMKKGAKLKDGFLLPEKLDLVKVNNNESLLMIEIHEGRNHIIKNFFKYFGKKVKKLKRISIGPIKLGELEPGKIVKLDYNEVKVLKKLL